MKTRVKICGLTRVGDAILAQKLGAWALGFIFYAKSPRLVSIDQVNAILEIMPDAASKKVGVFVNPTIEDLETVFSKTKLTAIQLHGHETDQFCTEVRTRFPNHEIIKATRLSDPALSFQSDYTLLDHGSDQNWGGTGQTVDWKAASHFKKEKLIVAGGITALNVLEAMKAVQPFAFDLSSGVESAPGIKSEEKLIQFFKTLEQGEQNA